MSTLQGLRVDHTLDARGLAPAEGYAKARALLKGMAEEHVLELFVDDGEGLRTIPFGLRADGHEIVVSEPARAGVRLLVRKRSAPSEASDGDATQQP